MDETISIPPESKPDGRSLPVLPNGQSGHDSQSSVNHGNLIHQLIESQQQLTAVERFSQRHADLTGPALAPQYKDLIPLELPGDDEQYSFEVDLDACSGCKACVAACHNLNGLEDGELWRNVGLLVGGSETEPEIQHVTSACHHCLEPACMHGCPVNAYEKDAVTGIVAHLDDQCIGCKYCMFMCPYDVPSYSQSKGIVRKCNMCADRLSVGEAPACVQACPNQAIKIRKVSRSEIVGNSETEQLVPGAPGVHLTLPTTRYLTDRVLPKNLLPNDYYVTKSLHAHFPLVFMLTLTQMALGIFAATFAVTQLFPGLQSGLTSRLDLLAFGVLVMGLNVAILHLGRPLKAYRAMANIRTSWLSREIAGFNMFAGAATMSLAWGWLAFPEQWTGVPVWIPSLATVVWGAIAVACSAMLYIVTKRPLWTGFRTNSLFFFTAAVLGCATVAFAISFLTSDSPVAEMLLPTNPIDAIALNDTADTADIASGTGIEIASQETTDTSATDASAASESTFALLWLVKAIIVFVIIKLGIESSVFMHLKSPQFTPWRHAALLMVGDMRWVTLSRYVFAIAGGIVVPLLFVVQFSQSDIPLSTGTAWMWLGAGLAMLLIGELIERYLFFAVSVARRMPGAPN